MQPGVLLGLEICYKELAGLSVSAVTFGSISILEQF